MTARIRAASRTLRASGPTLSRLNDRPMTPYRLTRVCVGLIPTVPQIAAGSRTEPPVSEPSAPHTAPAATAAPEPLDEPPVMRAGSHGLRQSP